VTVCCVCRHAPHCLSPWVLGIQRRMSCRAEFMLCGLRRAPFVSRYSPASTALLGWFARAAYGGCAGGFFDSANQRSPGPRRYEERTASASAHAARTSHASRVPLLGHLRTRHKRNSAPEGPAVRLPCDSAWNYISVLTPCQASCTRFPAERTSAHLAHICTSSAHLHIYGLLAPARRIPAGLTCARPRATMGGQLD
jgi:hypothetical protein